MSLIDNMIGVMRFNRGRTLSLLDDIAERSDVDLTLAWRPGPGRAHIAWQLMHVGVTEEIFATERLNPQKSRAFADLWPRFRGGSTPDDDVPHHGAIREVLDQGREHLIETLHTYNDSRLDEIVFVSRFGDDFSLRQTLQLIAWHESHHHGQSHITMNLYKAQCE